MKAILSLLIALLFSACTAQQTGPQTVAVSRWDPFLDTLQVRTLRYFLETTDSTTGLAPDRWPSKSPSSIAAVGFALTAYPIANERGLISRAEAARRTVRTLEYFWNLPQSTAADAGGYKGFFYHFLKMDSGKREWNCELSTIDTGLLIAGALFCQSYFDRQAPEEQRVRELADSLYRRVDWQWSMAGREGINLAWKPDAGFDKNTWTGYNETMIMHVLALGSPTYPAPETIWKMFTSKYVWATFYDQELVNFAPLFGHQYSHCWIDFRGIKDEYMRGKELDYFENSRRATYTHRAYGVDNPGKWRDYSDSIWGWTACDGPGDTTFEVDGRNRKFEGYAARGPSIDWTNDDGTLAPTALAGSLPFAPEICIPALKALRAKYDTALFRQHGFVDAFNPTFITPRTPNGWFDVDYLGIDQGPIVIMIENLRTGMVWDVMKKNPYIRKGLQRAGFTGGWLEEMR